MNILARLIAVAVLAVFAASSVVPAAGAAEMSVTMISFGDAAMDMSDCEACTDSDSDLPCKLICAGTSIAALPAPHAHDVLQPRAEVALLALTKGMLGFTGPPAKEPPKPLI
nr:hypothetical protein RNT25_04363 [arsenite-oxidising bacterium NT-25]